MVTDGDSYAMVAVSAADRVDLRALAALASQATNGGATFFAAEESVETVASSCSSADVLLGDNAAPARPAQFQLASEDQFASLFVDVEPGAFLLRA